MSTPDIHFASFYHPSVILEIPREWRLWRVYNSPGVNLKRMESWWPLYRLEDPMDEDDFDEFTSFPALKPNIDVFGIPCCSRKQRGWYHARPWPPRSPSLLSDSDSHPALAAGEDVPPELFEHILRELGLFSKHELAKASRVCRYWEAQCRPQLFDTLSFCSPQDVIVFREFKNDPACRFIPYLKTATVDMTKLSQLNWVHLLTQIWDTDHFEVRLSGMETPRSVHNATPRSLPQHFSRGITTLYLTKIHFRKFQDMTHLVGELPDLYWLRCMEVTWDSLPTGPPRQRPLTDRNKLELWDMENCSPPWCSAHIFLLPSMYSRSSFFSDDDFRCILALLETLEAGNKIYRRPKDSHVEFLGRKRSSLLVRCIQRPYVLYLAFESGSPNEHVLRDFLHIRAQPHPGPAGIPSFHVMSIGIDTARCKQPPADWAKLDPLIATKFPSLRTVVFGFRDRKSMLHFAEEVVDKQMPLLSSPRVVRYAVEYCEHWYQASRGSDQLQGPERRHLFEVYL